MPSLTSSTKPSPRRGATSPSSRSRRLGYLGGVAFEDDPIKGLLFGLGLAVTITALVEVVRYLVRRSRRAPAIFESADNRKVW